MESIGEPHIKTPITNKVSKIIKPTSLCSEITVKQFLDFLKTAYQVEGSVEGLLLAGGMTEAVNWLKMQNDLIKTASCQTSTEKLKTVEDKKEVNRKRTDSESETIKIKVQEVLSEGLLDSVLPYLIPSSSLISKKSSCSHTKLSEKSNSMTNLTTISKSDEKLTRKKSLDSLTSKPSVALREKDSNAEIEIHVCDEIKNIKKDFHCDQKLLVEKMAYFADVTSGQKLEDMEISVHCDIDVFEWLMKWVKKEALLEEDWPKLDSQNVVQILVSSAFLQMDPLVQDCLLYCHQHMNDILRNSVNLSCINDSLLTRLAAMYTNTEVEGIRDRKDKIQSRLFCKLIQSMAEPEPESMRGHWSSLAKIYQCGKCQQYISPAVSLKIPCTPPAMRLQTDGSVVSFHSRDPLWNINDFILKLHKSLKTWRKVYWRLWGYAHYLFCLACKRYFPVYQIGWCRYHSDPPQFFTVDTQKTPLPVGRYPCCGERAYRFQLLQNYSGCQFREHTVCTKNVKDSAVLGMLESYRHLIEDEPPQLMFPERLTRLVAREPSTGEKLLCNETFWWDGLQIIPPRPKLGLLSVFGESCKEIQESVLEKEKIEETTADEDTDEDASVVSSSESSSPGTEECSPPESPPPSFRKKLSPRRVHKRAKTKKKADSHLWQHNLSARSNQDFQRAYEENALKQITSFLEKKTCDGTLKVGKGFARNVTPLGGVWVRLESEFAQNRSLISNSFHQPKLRNIFTGKPKQQARTYAKF